MTCVCLCGGLGPQLWAGVPATFVRNLTADEIAKIKVAALDNVEVSRCTAGVCIRSQADHGVHSDEFNEKRHTMRVCCPDLCVSVFFNVPVRRVQLSSVHKAETSKDYKTVAQDEEDWVDRQQRSLDYWPRYVTGTYIDTSLLFCMNRSALSTGVSQILTQGVIKQSQS